LAELWTPAQSNYDLTRNNERHQKGRDRQGRIHVVHREIYGRGSLELEQINELSAKPNQDPEYAQNNQIAQSLSRKAQFGWKHINQTRE
jgi:hypothetical protein